MKRMDGCPTGGFDKFSFAKAHTCIALNMSSRTFRAKYTSGDTAKFVQALAMVGETGGELAPFPGGVLIRDASDGSVVGSVGVSGAAGDEDEYIALMGAKALQGCLTEPDTHSCLTLTEDS